MIQKGDYVSYEQKDEEGQWVTRYFKTKYEAKAKHGGDIHNCHPFMTDKELKRYVFGN